MGSKKRYPRVVLRFSRINQEKGYSGLRIAMFKGLEIGKLLKKQVSMFYTQGEVEK